MANPATIDAPPEIRSASNAGLLRTHASLTHQMDAAERAERPWRVRDLRAKRNVVAAEILRRMEA